MDDVVGNIWEDEEQEEEQKEEEEEGEEEDLAAPTRRQSRQTPAAPRRAGPAPIPAAATSCPHAAPDTRFAATALL